MYLIDRHQLLRKFHKYMALSDTTRKGKDNLTSAKRKNNKPGAACELPDGISLPRCAAPLPYQEAISLPFPTTLLNKTKILTLFLSGKYNENDNKNKQIADFNIIFVGHSGRKKEDTFPKNQHYFCRA